MSASLVSAVTNSSRLRNTGIALGAGLPLLGLLFHEEIVGAVRVWSESTAYNHCFLILPIALYLAWDRRAMLAGVPIRPVPWVGLGALPVAAGWLVAERLGIMEGRQIALIALVEFMFLCVLGWRMFGKLAAPLLYLFFLVPFGAFIVPALQTFTARFIDFGLGLTALPYYIDNFTIEIPEGAFYVAEACAGLRFLIASVAFGVLYAVLIYRSWGKRTMFIAASIVVPVIANGFRALGIVWLGHVLGSAQAAAADHLVYGWIFFSIVLLLLVAIGLPFREDNKTVASPRPVSAAAPAPLGASLAAAAILLACAAAGPAAAALIDRKAAVTPLTIPDLRLAGCAPLSPPADAGDLQAGAATASLTCEGGAIRLQVAVFAPAVGPGPVLAAQRRMIGLTDGTEIDVTRLAVPGSPVPWRLADAREPPPHTAATALWINGAPSVGGLSMRALQAANSLRRGGDAPVVLTATVDYRLARPAPTRDWPQALLVGFLAAHPDLDAAMRRLAAEAAAAR
jgi:exosortase A